MATEYNLGTAKGVIEIEYKGDGARQAQEDLKGTSTTAQKSNDNLKKTSRGFGIAGLAIAGGFALAAKSAADFEQRMSAVAAVSGASQQELDALRQKSLQLGKDTAFSAAESAAAIEELVKAGLSVEDVLNGAADATVNLAAAGEVDMVTAATIASNAMNQFNLSAEDMVDVVDNIAGAANASAIDVGDFGMSLSQVGAVANLAGANFKDTATAIALMGNAGIKGSDAGTSLKTMLMNLQPSTKKQIDLFKELGIITKDGSNRFYDAQGNLKSLADVSGVLQGSLRGMTKAQKQAALEVMFGSDAIRAAAVLADNGSKGFDKMSKSMNKVSAADVAAKRMDNLKGSLEEMMGSLETLGITVGTLVLPPLRKLVDKLTEAMNWFLNLSPAVQKIIVAFLGAVGAILLIVATVIKITLAIRALNIALAGTRLAFITTWLAALGPIALVIAAIAAIGLALFILWKKSETFRDIVTAVWNAVKVAILAAVRWVVNFLAASLTFLRSLWASVWGTFGPLVKAVWAFIVAILRLYWTIIKGVVLLGIRAVKAVLSAIWGAIGEDVKKAWDTVVKIIGTAVSAIGDTVGKIMGVVTDALSGAATWLYDAGKAIIQGLIDGIVDMLGPVTDTIDRVTGAMGKFLPGSPVKEGPLKVLNRGKAGRQIVEMLVDGISDMQRPLEQTVNAVLAVPSLTADLDRLGLARNTSLATPERVSRSLRAGSGGRGASSSVRVLQGMLDITPRGKAYIRGTAEDVVEGNERFAASHGRMR